MSQSKLLKNVIEVMDALGVYEFQFDRIDIAFLDSRAAGLGVEALPGRLRGEAAPLE